MFNGQKIRELLEYTGITQKEFCKRIGITEQSLYGYYNPDANPTSKTLEKIANELKCSLDYLFDRESESSNINIGHQVKGNGNKVLGDITLSECRKEIAHLKELLAEKERTIQILMNK